eukprot:TRINITY_DN66026_c0_g1_i1.p1 TRINITY_DN66026_c0_g1~~TRINITY_DN66026_c0_g1_i1.p1  ORF type:complete len:519 (+),score=112.73 TRINITY_DN66026_c0_g1_i1:129-1559(+)
MASRLQLPSNCAFALRSVCNSKAGFLEGSLLDVRGPVLKSAERQYQLEEAEQCLRFADCDPEISGRHLDILARALQNTKLEDRSPWWKQLRSCRRREQGRKLETLPFGSCFLEQDRSKYLVVNAIIVRMRTILASRGIWPADAFHSFDSDGSGGFDAKKLADFIKWLIPSHQYVSGVPNIESRIADVLHQIDTDGNGRIDLEEFKAAMEPDDDDEVAEVATPKRQKLPKRLSAFGAQAAQVLPHQLERGTQGRYAFKWNIHLKFQEVWSTNPLSEAGVSQPFSLWAPALEAENAPGSLKISLGHVACTSSRAPRRTWALEVCDQQFPERGKAMREFAQRELENYVNTMLPRPVRFREVWKWQSEDQKPLVIWEAVPPTDDFVALGMIASTSLVEPSTTEIRCIPLPWADHLGVERVARIWSTSASRVPASFWAPMVIQRGSAISAHEFLFKATTGHMINEAPAMKALPPVNFCAAA